MRLNILVWSALAGVALAAPRILPPPGAIIVAPSRGHFIGLQDAIDSINPNSTKMVKIFIYPGTYSGQVYVNKTVKVPITIYGYTENDQDYKYNQVKLTHSLGADVAGSNDLSGTLRAHSSNFSVYNINIENSRGAGVQAIALSAQGNYQAYYGCQFLGYQDTVLVNEGRNVFDKSLISGAVDYIFGQRAIAWFERCTIEVVGVGFITANGRNSSEGISWYVFNESEIVAKAGVNDSSTYLGRPWRAYSRVVFQNTNMSAVVRQQGWSTWNVPLDNVTYYEYANTGPGSVGPRVDWALALDAPVVLTEIVGDTSWIDMRYWNTGVACKSSLFAQCGGALWPGCTSCSRGVCRSWGKFFSQCLL